MKVFYIISFICLCCVCWFSCESSTYEEISGDIANPTYTNSIKSIIVNNCLSCHSKSSGTFPTMETYAQLREATEVGDVICRIDNQSCGSVMPQTGKMPQVTISTIKKWAASGFPN